MPRIKRGKTAKKRKKNILKHTKGYRFDRKTKVKAAKEALLHAWTYSFKDRKRKKREFRKLWQIKINAETRKNKIPYSKFINKLKKANIKLNRKMLAELAENSPKVFEKILETVSKKTN